MKDPLRDQIPAGRPSRSHRAAAAVALGAAAAALLYLAMSAIFNWYVVLTTMFFLGVAVIAAWYILSRRGAARAIAGIVMTLALVGFAAVVIATQSVIVLGIALGLAGVSISAASYALGPVRTASNNAPAPRAHHPVLLMNLKSGGGKAERFKLADLCWERGIEPVVLHPGDDLHQLAKDAVARGADVLGMAGGDGSQAVVASVASQHQIPLVVVPAGTRNHFALDLGLDRADVPGSLNAFEDGVDTVVDLAEVNGRVFVNNASMGVYARIVQAADYRDAKLQTAAAMLPDLLGPQARPFDLHFTLPSGDEAVGAQLLLVSNNPYAVARLRGGGSRERLDGGVLGIAFVRVDTAAEAETLALLDAADRARHFARWNDWTAPEFEVRSSRPVEVGVDGEALMLQPPLHFVSRPGALRVRLPRTAPRRSPAARAAKVIAKPTVIALWQTVLGRPTGSP
ncbi:MAG: diacylglycerol/lipid kinase family protein [Propionibacteriaceae bacterium]